MELSSAPVNVSVDICTVSLMSIKRPPDLILKYWSLAYHSQTSHLGRRLFHELHVQCQPLADPESADFLCILGGNLLIP